MKCLRVLYERNIAVKVGSGCVYETENWITELYREVYRQEISRGYQPSKMLRWLIQNNRYSRTTLQLNELGNMDLTVAMHEAIRHVDCSDGGTLSLEVNLTPGPLPDILKRNLRYLSVLINTQNIDPRHIPDILQSNPQMTGLNVAIHVNHCGGTSRGSCTRSKVPLLPNQDVRISGQQTTIPGHELKYRLRRDLATQQITQTWRSYTSRRRPEVTRELNRLNVFGIPNFRETEWSETLLERLRKWEEEVNGWFTLCPKLQSITVVLNTVQSKFGRLERYWCTCSEKE